MISKYHNDTKMLKIKKFFTEKNISYNIHIVKKILKKIFTYINIT